MPLADELKTLQELHEKGKLTDQEYADAKAATLNGGSADDQNIAFLKRLTDELAPHVSALLILKGDVGTPDDVLNTAMASFVDTGKERILVTCAHVFESYRKKKSEDPSVTLALALPEVNKVLTVKEEWILECGNKKLDLATIKLPEADLIADFGKRYFKAGKWPPARVTTSGMAEVVGFQGGNRRAVPGGLQLNFTAICLPVESIADRHFALHIEEKDQQIIKMNPNLGEIGPLGGMSGSAGYFENESGVREIAGFVYQGDWLSDQEKDAIMYLNHADLIREDGKLNWGRLAP